MPLMTVACPGCQAPLKAPAGMAGKKARCKKCNTPFRLPGPVPDADSVSESQALSVADPPPKPAPDEDDVPAAMPVDDDEPLAAAIVEDEPLPAAVVEDDPPPPPPPDPFAFTDAPAKKKERRPREEKAEAPPPPPVEAGDPFAFSSAPEPGKKKERRPRDDAPAPEPAPAAAGDPFAFSGTPAEPAAAKKDKDRKPRDGDDRPADRKKPAAAAGGGGGLVKVVIGAAVFAVVAGGVVVAGLLVFLNNKPTEQAKAEKKDEKKIDPPSNEPPPAPTPPPAPPDKGKDANKGNKGTGGPAPKPGTKAKGGMLALAPGKAIAFPPKAAAPKGVEKPVSNPLPLAVPFADARRFFPPGKADGDIGVLWRSAAGFQGAGEKVTLTLFSPNSGNAVTKVEADHDGTADPAADVSADGTVFALGNRATGRLTVWDTRKKTKVLDALDLYGDKPDHKAAKLAALYLTEPATRAVTVTTAGAVHVWDIPTKALVGEFVPPKAAAGKVAGGRGAAAFPNRQGVVVAVGGAVYKVDAAGEVAGVEAEDLGGDVGRSLALAVSPEGKVVYAFETDADGKRERAVVQLKGGPRGPILRWPADAGEPVAAGWAGDAVAALATSQGAAVWFDADGGFNPLAIARTPDDKAAHAVAGTDHHWTLLPAAGDPKGCVVVELTLPPAGVGDPLTPAARRPTAALLLDLKGLSQ